LPSGNSVFNEKEAGFMEKNGAEEGMALGANYWPAEKGIYWWREFEVPPLHRDFSLAAEYGLDLIRIFLLWEDFQPEINRVSVPALKDLVRVADLAQDHRIKILPTFFCGHVTGINWLPPWMVERGKGEGRYPLFSMGKMRRGKARNLYSDREVWKAQKLLIHETTDALQDHPAVWGWDLGNQTSNLVNPPSRDSARAWFEEMVTELRRWDSSLPITWGMDQSDLEKARVPGPQDLVPYCDFISLQLHPGQAEWADGLMDERPLSPKPCNPVAGGRHFWWEIWESTGASPHLTEGSEKLEETGLIKRARPKPSLKRALTC
jgi:endo-1,4-beta-mannosidase